MNSKNLLLYLSKNIIVRSASPSNILKGLVAQNRVHVMYLYYTICVWVPEQRFIYSKGTGNFETIFTANIHFNTTFIEFH